MSELPFLAALLLAFILIATGVLLVAGPGAALIASGVLLGMWAWVALTDDSASST